MSIKDFRFVENAHQLPVVIAREHVQDYFPWLTNSRMKNLDWQGNGPKGAFKIGKKIIYPTQQLLEWLDSKIEEPVRKRDKSDQNSSVKNVYKSRHRGRKTKQQQILEKRNNC